jgi:hypothetical protein
VWEALVKAAVQAIKRDGPKAITRFMLACTVGCGLLLISICIFIAHELGLPWPKLSPDNLKTGGAISLAGLGVSGGIRALRKIK